MHFCINLKNTGKPGCESPPVNKDMCMCMQKKKKYVSTCLYFFVHVRIYANQDEGRSEQNQLRRSGDWMSLTSALPLLPCHVYRCIAVCCSVLQCVAVCCSALAVVNLNQMTGSLWHQSCHCFPVLHIGALQYVAVRCNVLLCVAVCCSVLQCVAVCCSVLQRVAVLNPNLTIECVNHESCHLHICMQPGVSDDWIFLT